MGLVSSIAACVRARLPACPPACLRDTENHRVVLLDVATGAFERAIGSQGSGDGQFNGPRGMAALPGGRLAVADTINHRVVVLAPAAGV